MADFALVESPNLISRDRKIMKFPHCDIFACHKFAVELYDVPQFYSVLVRNSFKNAILLRNT